jgi:hypothetical protein
MRTLLNVMFICTLCVIFKQTRQPTQDGNLPTETRNYPSQGVFRHVPEHGSSIAYKPYIRRIIP